MITARCIEEGYFMLSEPFLEFPMPQVGNMKDKAALVTGASSGLGRATALALARAGADLCLVGVNTAGLTETAVRVQALGVKAWVHATDLSKPDNCRAAVAATAKALGRLDALCNVAGVIFFARSHDMPAADWEKTLAVNLSAPFYLSQAAIPHLINSEGAVVNVASSGAFMGQAYLAAYGASKAALIQMTKAMAMEYIHKPIRFNAVAPGGMATRMTAGLKFPEGLDLSLVQRYAPLRGLLEIDDVAELVAFLASDAARGYHGTCITIDNGMTAG
jgi:NAD(P)-dependent dehydrogenase (short-subunit alcohol dehydrogenase family)